MIYFIIVVILLVLSVHFDINRRTKNKEGWYNIVLIIFVCLAGLRYRIGIDSINYCYKFYHETPSFFNLFKDLSLTEYPLWKLLNSIVFTIGGKFYIVQFVESAFVNLLFFAYIKKHSSYIFTCVFLYFIWLYPGCNFEELKQAFAVSISLYANDFILEKKYMKGVGLFVIACLFHFAAIIVALFSFLRFLRLNAIGFSILLIVFIIGGVIQNYYGDYLELLEFDDFLQMKAEVYMESDRFGSLGDRNIKFYIIQAIPLFIYFISFWYSKKYGRNRKLAELEPFLVLGFISVVLGWRIGIFYRYENFYIIYFILFLAQAFVDVIRNNRTANSIVIKAVIPSILFCLYILTTYVGLTGKYNRYHKFYPYSSVIEKSIDRQREITYINLSNSGRIYPPRSDEY